MLEDFLCGVEDLGRRMEKIIEENAPKVPSVPPLGSSWFAAEQNKSKQQPKRAKKPKRLNLATVNPSLHTVGLEVVERLMPRYLPKAGLACERMQHAGLPGPFIANVLEATFGEQTDAQLSEVFHYFDADGGGYLDEDEFVAIAPLLGEDVPGDSLAALMSAIDTDCNGTVTCDEFIIFLRECNPRGDGRDGWRTVVPEQLMRGGPKAEQTVMLTVQRRHDAKGGDKQRWRPANQADVAKPQRGRDGSDKQRGQPAAELAVRRVDLHNAQAMIDTLRELRMADAQVATVVAAIFVEKSEEAYAKVFDIFDTDSTGGIDQQEFHQITALLGNHASETETRALFLSANKDCNGLLDVIEFTALLRALSPAAQAGSTDDAHYVRTLHARERLQARIGERGVPSEEVGGDAPVTCKGLVLGASRAGKTHLLNQIVSEKLPKGKTLTVGFSALQMRVGQVAIQLLDTPGDLKFSPLAKVFHG